MLHVHVHAACPCPCCMIISMLHVPALTAYPCPCCMSQYVLSVQSMLHAHVHAACPCPCCQACTLDIDTQHVLGQAAWTWTRSIHWDMQHGHGQACTGTRSMDKYRLHPYACLCPCPGCMFMSMLPCCISKSMLLSYPYCMSQCKYMLHIHVHAEFLSTCYMSMSMLHASVYVAFHVHAVFHLHAVCPRPWYMPTSMLHVQVHAARTMDMQHGQGHAAWTWACSMDIGTQHRYGHAAWVLVLG